MDAMSGEIAGLTWTDHERDKKFYQASSPEDVVSVTSASSNRVQRSNKPPCAGTLYVTIEGCEDLVPTARKQWDPRANFDISHPYVAVSMISIYNCLNHFYYPYSYTVILP